MAERGPQYASGHTPKVFPNQIDDAGWKLCRNYRECGNRLPIGERGKINELCPACFEKLIVQKRESKRARKARRRA